MIRYLFICAAVALFTFTSSLNGAGEGIDNNIGSAEINPPYLFFRTLDMDWGGYLKVQGGISKPPQGSLIGIFSTNTFMDGYIEGRLTADLFFGDKASFQTQYEIVMLGGDTYQWRRKIEDFFPNIPSRPILSSGLPEDDRRLLDLTKTICDGGNHVLYNRLDRLFLELRPDWGVIRIGRQAMTWGNGFLFNPMDLFNPFAPTDVGREFKIGDDMVSVQIPFLENDILQTLYVPRRNPETADVAWNQSSFALSHHMFLDGVELDAMVSKHYEDYVAGIGGIGYLADAAWRIDLTWTFLDSNSESDSYLSLVANLDYSWVWWNKNCYGFIEFFYSGIGERNYVNALTNPDIYERLDRGELFTLGRYYSAANLQVEIHPLVNAFLTAITNLKDPSGVVQPRITYDIVQDVQILMGANLYWGSRNTEFGGFEIPNTRVYLQPANGVYLWLSYYF